MRPPMHIQQTNRDRGGVGIPTPILVAGGFQGGLHVDIHREP